MIIETHNLSKRFLRHDAVRGLDLAVPEGAAMALIGPNGAGKTTTIRLLMNLLRPDGGQASVLGVDSRRLSPDDFSRIGYVSENQQLPKALTVEQYFAYLRRLYPAWDAALEADLRKRLDLPAGRRIGKLSHGMRMKLALASALPFHPRLLVLDEPLSGLDPLVRDEVMENLLVLAGEMTVLISSHELAEIEGAATHVAFMDKGRVLFQESMEDLTGRFREVTVLASDGGRDLTAPPAAWIGAERSGALIRFIDTRFQGEAQLTQAVTERLGRTDRIEIQPMPLRAISKAMMRETRKETV